MSKDGEAPASSCRAARACGVHGTLRHPFARVFPSMCICNFELRVQCWMLCRSGARGSCACPRVSCRRASWAEGVKNRRIALLQEAKTGKGGGLITCRFGCCRRRVGR
eukprot:2339650-Rhodomonas_salina.1